MNSQGGINDCLICDTPIAVVDLETTGLYPGGDRIVEIAIVRVEPGKKPCLAMNTLVNPKRPVTATEIHGITDADVADAPYFEDLASSIASAMAGCVVAAYNVYRCQVPSVGMVINWCLSIPSLLVPDVRASPAGPWLPLFPFRCL